MKTKDLVNYKVNRCNPRAYTYMEFDFTKDRYTIKVTSGWLEVDRYVVEVIRDFSETLTWRLV